MATISEVHDDREVRAMVNYSHTPREIYAADGRRLALLCDACGAEWRCTSRSILDAWVEQHEVQARTEGLLLDG